GLIRLLEDLYKISGSHYPDLPVLLCTRRLYSSLLPTGTRVFAAQWMVNRMWIPGHNCSTLVTLRVAAASVPANNRIRHLGFTARDGVLWLGSDTLFFLACRPLGKSQEVWHTSVGLSYLARASRCFIWNLSHTCFLPDCNPEKGLTGNAGSMANTSAGFSYLVHDGGKRNNGNYILTAYSNLEPPRWAGATHSQKSRAANKG